MSRANYKAQQFIDAIPNSGGIITTIAGRVGCSWHTAKKYITRYATIRRAYTNECEGITDLAESTVIKAIRDDDVNTAKWYLTMKAKDRGYTSRSEVDVTTAGEKLVAFDADTIAEALQILGGHDSRPGSGS